MEKKVTISPHMTSSNICKCSITIHTEMLSDFLWHECCSSSTKYLTSYLGENKPTLSHSPPFAYHVFQGFLPGTTYSLKYPVCWFSGGILLKLKYSINSSGAWTIQAFESNSSSISRSCRHSGSFNSDSFLSYPKSSFQPDYGWETTFPSPG